MAKPQTQLTPAEQARAAQLRKEWELHLLATDPEELFTVTAIQEPMPHRARLHASIACADCGELTMETRVRRLAGREICLPCFERAFADL